MMHADVVLQKAHFHVYMMKIYNSTLPLFIARTKTIALILSNLEIKSQFSVGRNEPTYLFMLITNHPTLRNVKTLPGGGGGGGGASLQSYKRKTELVT